MIKMDRSKNLFKQAKELIPGGVNSPVRACKSVGAEPLFIAKGNGSKIYDEDGNEYIDYIGSWGPLIVGHSNKKVLKAIIYAGSLGTSFGAPSKSEVTIAKLITEAIPSIEMVRMVNSGTEATMSAIRLARAYTKRDIIIKFDGCYHGHADSLLVDAGSGLATLGIAQCPGIPAQVASHTLSLPYNDLAKVEEVMAKLGDKVAAIIVEPIVGNMGLVVPKKGFLEGLRKVTTKFSSLLIFDEVMTGFRVAFGGAQALYKIEPDLTCLGKIIGGGLPVGAYGGRRDIMENIAPLGAVYQAGTLSGNPIAMAAGITMLNILKKPDFYEKLNKVSERLKKGLEKAAKKSGLPVFVDGVGSMLGLFFNNSPVKNYDDAKKSNLKQYAFYFNAMREEHIFLPPSQFEAFFVSSAHSEKDIDKTISAAERVFRAIKDLKI